VAFPENAVGTAVGVADRDTVERDYSHELRRIVEHDLEIKVSIRGSIQHAPELAFRRPHLDRGRLRFGIEYRDEIHRQVLARFVGIRF
jgi:hypothetical protein